MTKAKRAWAVKRVSKAGFTTYRVHPQASRQLSKSLAHDASWESDVKEASCVEVEIRVVREVWNSNHKTSKKETK